MSARPTACRAGFPLPAVASLLLLAALPGLAACTAPPPGPARDAPAAPGPGGPGGPSTEPPTPSPTPYWVNPDGRAARAVAAHLAAGRTPEAELLRKISDRPAAEWIGPDRPEEETRALTEAATRAGREALLVLYDVPNRDCGRHSAGGKPFVIDTSRNENGPWTQGDPADSWCNPPGRALGEPPTRATGDPLVAAYLWIKRPGESDGTCRGGPKAGEWFDPYAQELARNAR
ncbi:glycoside hydrolase family 6 protein [Streptomyces sp. SJL17-4]|uniref:glycoside hydrolase family 6 protein n=1 Tax=Streptomyces sp. SJL17-4 TaxID=2967224 RepID=UPI0030CD8880